MIKVCGWPPERIFLKAALDEERAFSGFMEVRSISPLQGRASGGGWPPHDPTPMRISPSFPVTSSQLYPANR